MKKLLLLVLITLPLMAQVVAVKTTSTTVTATAGTLVASFVSQFPPPTTGVQVSIVDTAINFKQTFNQPLPVGSTNAATGQINTAAGAISWSLALPTAGGAITYSVASTPTGGTTSTGNGSF